MFSAEGWSLAVVGSGDGKVSHAPSSTEDSSCNDASGELRTADVSGSSIAQRVNDRLTEKQTGPAARKALLAPHCLRYSVRQARPKAESSPCCGWSPVPSPYTRATWRE